MRRLLFCLLLSAQCAPDGDRSSVETSSGANEVSVDTVGMRQLPVANAPIIDGLRIVEAAGAPLILYSTERSIGNQYALEIHSIPIAEPARTTRVAAVPRLLPPPPRWDVRRLENGQYEIVVEYAGGAVNALQFYAAGSTTSVPVSAAHPFEGFTRPHFVRTASTDRTNEIAAVADHQRVVVFTLPGGESSPYRPLIEAVDGVVGRGPGLWVVEKSVISGPARYDVMPGRLAIARFDTAHRVVDRITIPDSIVFEFDAAALRDDIVVFLTGQPARLFLASRLNRPLGLSADDSRALLELSRPAVYVGPTTLHLAAIAHAGSDRAMVMYGSIPLDQISR